MSRCIGPVFVLLMSACGLETSVLAPGDAHSLDADSGGSYGDGGTSPMDTGTDTTGGEGRVDSATEAGADTAPPPADGAADSSVRDTGGPVAPPFCDPADPSLVLCVRFEDALVDESAAAHTLRPGGLTYAGGRVGRAGLFGSSVSTWIEQEGDLTGEPLTIELFIRPDSVPSSGRIGLWDIGSQHSAWIRPGGEVACRSIAVAAAVAAGRWTHLACVFDGDSSRVYVDGAEQATGVSVPSTPGAGDIRLGANAPDGDHFEGRLDELRIFRGARSASEIASAAAR